MPSYFSSGYYFLFLEQYIFKKIHFQINTQKIVNLRGGGVNQGTSIYLYDLEKFYTMHPNL